MTLDSWGFVGTFTISAALAAVVAVSIMIIMNRNDPE